MLRNALVGPLRKQQKQTDLFVCCLVSVRLSYRFLHRAQRLKAYFNHRLWQYHHRFCVDLFIQLIWQGGFLKIKRLGNTNSASDVYRGL